MSIYIYIYIYIKTNQTLFGLLWLTAVWCCLFCFCFFFSPRGDQTERTAYHRFKEIFLNSLWMSIKLVPVFKTKKQQKKRADKRRQGTLPVFCIPSSPLWASLMCLPQSLFWLPPAVSFSPLHWRGFWLTKIKHELLEPHVSAGDPKRRPLPAFYTHQGCKKKSISNANITQKTSDTATTAQFLDALRPWCRLPSCCGRSKLILNLCLGAAAHPVDSSWS